VAFTKVPAALLLPTAFLTIVFLSGCDPREPPETSGGQPNVTVEPSSIIIPISVRSAQLNAGLNQKFNSAPVFQGRTPELNAKLVVEEPITVERAEQVLVTAAVPGYCVIKKVPRTIVEHVKVGVETVKCALTPWKWGNCARDVFRDVTRTVWDDVKECVADQAAVFKTVMKPVIELKENLLPTSVWINYEGLGS
jgi:hypothetical protein